MNKSFRVMRGRGGYQVRRYMVAVLVMERARIEQEKWAYLNELEERTYHYESCYMDYLHRYT